jgi:hypothetical protein
MGAYQVHESMPDLFPSPVYVAKVTAGATAGDVLITSSADYTLFQVPAGVYITDLAWQVTTAFTGDVDLSLGVSTGLADFAAVADVDATTADVNLVRMSGLGVGLAGGSDAVVPALAASGYLVPSTGEAISVTVQTATAATGSLDVYLFYVYASQLPQGLTAERQFRTHQFKAGHGV